MQSYANQTPGVYTIEQNAFSNSVVGVATAIPAFIGYTEKAVYNGKDLSRLPTRVESMQEFETFFGEADLQRFKLTPAENTAGSKLAVAETSITFTDPVTKVGTKYSLAPATDKLFYLYHSVHLFYLNGGSTCYIISIGSYVDEPSDKGGFELAIDSLEYEQDPTMILCPDALRLTEPEYYEVAQYMLKHCSEVQSRVAILDVYGGALSDPLQMSDPIAVFRNGVGQNHLNYGIAYFPWVKTSVVSETKISFRNLDEVSLALLKNQLNPDDSATARATDVKNAIDAANAESGKIDALTADAKRLAPLATKAATDLAKASVNAAQAVAKATAVKAIGAVKTSVDEVKAATAQVKAAVTSLAAAQADVSKDATPTKEQQAEIDKQTGARTTALAAAAAAEVSARTAGTAASAAVDTATQAANDVDANADAPAVPTTAKTDKVVLATVAAVGAAASAAKAAGNASRAADKDEVTAADTAADKAVTAAAAAVLQASLTQDKADAAVATTAAQALAARQTANDASKAEQAVAESGRRPSLALQRANTMVTTASSRAKMVPKLSLEKLEVGGPMENIFDQALTLQKDALPELPTQALLAAKRKVINNTLIALFPDYDKTMGAIAGYLSTLPVAPAMAGVYTATDNDRGVWKAPANVSLSAVMAPTMSLSDSTQASLNVDAVSGKSINAIRTFPNLGVLVWGARTLDGNSQDWRYVNVRRTMIMIEESIKLSMRKYVFEPNDANTWTTVKSMINSFLFTLWKQGALPGATPADAFQVSIGLGTTMTGDDILNGIMNVSVLVVLDRPAEFIVLTFQQEMQKS